MPISPPTVSVPTTTPPTVFIKEELLILPMLVAIIPPVPPVVP